jgi:hypothetical protein
MDCVKACPHDNIVIALGAPARDLLIDPVRSSIGRLSSRIDIAIVAMVLVCAAFASAATMIEPVTAQLDRVALSMTRDSSLAVSFFIALLLPVTLVATTGAAAYATRSLSSAAQSTHTLFCRLSFALLPVGLSMWAAHLLFHLFSGWTTLKPGWQQAAIDFGIRGFGPPQWGATNSLLSANGLLSVQLLILDAGLLLSLYVGWRIARELVSGWRRAAWCLLPWAVIALALYSLGVWILLQPMQMRNMVHG